jgi:3-oxoadipate enol-lactonase
MPYVKVNGINLYYQVTGKGEPLVMIMGFSADHNGWTSQAPFFKKFYQDLIKCWRKVRRTAG